MKRILLSGAMALLLLAGFVAGVSSQGAVTDEVLARLRPLLVEVRQSVPVSLTLAVPVSTTGTQTVTVPATVDVQVAIRLDSTLSPTVEVGQGEAVVTVSAPAIDEESVDDLGIPYTVAFDESGMEFSEWTAYESVQGWLEISGELVVELDESIQFVEIVVRWRGKGDKLIRVTDHLVYVGGPGRTARFNVMPSLESAVVAGYTIEVKAIR